MTAAISYGCDYNPEQWDAQTVAEDMRLMRQAGVTLVSVGIFSWAELEPRPGEYQLDWLGAILDLLHQSGIGVSLATPTAAVPLWFAHANPDALAVSKDGRRVAAGSRSGLCPTSPSLRQAADGIVTQVATRFGDHPGLRLWHIGNEYGGEGCYCERCSAWFRQWVRERHGGLDAVNEAWGATFWSQRLTSWDQIAAPRDTADFSSPGRMLDWRRAWSDLLLETYVHERALVEEVTGTRVPFTTNFMGAYPYLDYARWAPHVDVVSNDTYPDPADPAGARTFAFDSDLMRSLGQGRPFIQLEQTTGAVQWRDVNVTKRPGRFRLWSLQTVARGADAICQFQWRQSAFGAEALHSAMVPHAGISTRIWREVTELGADLARLEQVAGTTVAAEIGIVVDWDAMWARRSAIGAGQESPDARMRAWHAAFFELGHQVDVVPWTGRLDRYTVLVLPGLFMLTAGQAAALERWVRDGGIVIADALTGVVDERHHVHLGGYLGTVAPFFGLRVHEHLTLPDETTSRDPSARITSAIAVTPPRAEATSDELGTLTFTRLVEDVEPAGADVVARFRGGDLDGRPAVLRHSIGGGGAWYVAGALEPASLRTVADAVVAHAGISPVVADVPVGVEAVRRGEVLFLLNHGDRPARVDGLDGHDLLSGRSVGSECSPIEIPAAGAVALVRR